RQGVVGVEVLLLEVVIHIGSRNTGDEVVGELIGGTTDIGGRQAAVNDGVMAHAGLGAHRGETTSAQLKARDFLGYEQGAGGGFRQQTAVVGGENRAGDELVAILQDS